MSELGDIYRRTLSGHPHIVVDIKRNPSGVYTYKLYNMYTGQLNSWVEPIDRKLSSLYWEFLV